jgi:hypothetical protein
MVKSQIHVSKPILAIGFDRGTSCIKGNGDTNETMMAPWFQLISMVALSINHWLLMVFKDLVTPNIYVCRKIDNVLLINDAFYFMNKFQLV